MAVSIPRLPLAVVSVRPGPANWFWSWFWSMVLAGIDHVLGWIFMVCGCMCLDCMMVLSGISSGTVIFKWSLPITIYIHINGPFPWQTVWLPCRWYIPNNIDHWGLTSTMTLWRYGDTNRTYPWSHMICMNIAKNPQEYPMKPLCFLFHPSLTCKHHLNHPK